MLDVPRYLSIKKYYYYYCIYGLIAHFLLVGPIISRPSKAGTKQRQIKKITVCLVLVVGRSLSYL